MANNKVKLEAVISASAQGMVDALKRASSAVNDSTASWKDRFSRAKGDLSVVSEAVRNLTNEVGKMGEIDIKADPGAVERLRDMLSGLEGVFGAVQGDVSALTDALTKMRNEAGALSMPVEEYQRFGEAVQAAGMDMEAAGEMVSRMQSMIQGFANGVPEAVDLFGRLGLTLEQLGQNSPAGNLQAIASAIQGVVPASEQASASVQVYGRSLQDVVRVAQEYAKILAAKNDTQYASDREIQGAIGLANALENVGRSLEGVAGRLASVGSEEERNIETLSRWEEVHRAMLSTLDAYNSSLGVQQTRIGDAASAYRSMSSMAEELGRVFTNLAEDADTGAVVSRFEDLQSLVSDFAGRLRTELENVQRILDWKTTLSNGSPIDTSEYEQAIEHIRLLREAYESLQAVDVEGVLGTPGFEALGTAVDEIGQLEEGLRRAGDPQLLAGIREAIGQLGTDIDAAAAGLNVIMDKPVKVRPEIDLKPIAALQERLDRLRVRFAMLGDEARESLGADAFGGLESTMARIQEQLHRNADEMARFAAESGRLVGFGERIGSSFASAGRSIGGAILHPIRSMQQLHDWILRTIDAMNGLSGAAGGAASSASGGVKQIVGMLFGVGSAVAAAVKAFRMIGNIIRDNLIEPLRDAWKLAMQLSEHQLGLNKDLYGNQATKWRNAKKDLEAYYEAWRKMRAEEATQEDAERERQSRRNLERSYNIEIDASTGDMEGQIAGRIDEAQRQYIKALEGQERELSKAMEQAEESMRKVQAYWTSGIWYGGNKGRYEGDIKSLQDKINALASEYSKVTEALHKARIETAGADFAAMASAKSGDEEAKRYREEEEARAKAEAERLKARSDAMDELDKWASETLEAEGQRRINAIYDKYEQMLLSGIPEEEAKPIFDEALRKEIERQEAERAEALKRINEEYGRERDKLAEAMRKEADAKRRLLESYKALTEAQEREAYRIRLDEIGKAREKLKRQMDKFGFTLPDGFKSSKPNLSSRERRQIRMDDRIADKLARRQRGERVHFTPRELDRIKALERLQKKDKNLSAEEKAIKAAQTQEAAAKTMQSASDTFKEAVKAFYEAATGRKLADGKEKQARQKRDRERAKAGDKAGKAERTPKWSDGGRPAPKQEPPVPKQEPKPTPKPVPKPEPPKPAPEPKPEPKPVPEPKPEPVEVNTPESIPVDAPPVIPVDVPEVEVDVNVPQIDPVEVDVEEPDPVKVEQPEPVKVEQPEPVKVENQVPQVPTVPPEGGRERTYSFQEGNSRPREVEPQAVPQVPKAEDITKGSGLWQYSLRDNGTVKDVEYIEPEFDLEAYKKDQERRQADAEKIGKIIDGIQAGLDSIKLPVEERTQPVATVEQPVEQRTQPVDTSVQPVETVEQPVDVQKQPVEERTQPVDTVKQPVDVKKQPVDTSKQPVDTVEQPVEEKEQPVDVHKQPVESVEQPVEEKEQPVGEKTQPVATVEQPVDRQIQPVETRTMPVEARTQPVDVKTMPVDMVTQPVEVAEQPVDTKVQPVDQAVQPVEVTEQPVESRTMPVATVKQPVERVEQPVAKSVQPVESRTQAVEVRTMPVASVEQPVDTEVQPVETKTMPVDSVMQPVDQVVQPVASVEQPVGTQKQPVEIAEQPVEAKTQPVETVTQPVQVAVQPVEMAEQPVEIRTMPVDTVEQPVESKTMPVDQVVQPVEVAEQPVEVKTMPVEVAIQPVDKVMQPVDTRIQPVEQVVQQVEQIEQPVDTKIQPVDQVEQPVERVEQPVQITKQPVDTQIQPVEQVKQPVEVAEQPVQTVEQPVQVAEQPVEVKTMPVEQVVQPVATVEQPVEDKVLAVEDRTLHVDAKELAVKMPELPKRLYAPPRVFEGQNLGLPVDHDYTALLEGIKAAIENSGKNKFTVV